MYHSESDIDCLYKGGNPRSGTTLQNRIIEVRDQTSYGSESNLNFDERRVSEVSGMNRMSTENLGLGIKTCMVPDPVLITKRVS